ncbi:porin [Moritella yayanosii]|uniref:Outer membrane protein OmpU n=1 Tax=Moritella yayanosii TaxID=69539 RepID=A0A330LQ79_9GAMM|nr:porin [Moritella yayanosii]SQD78346.1 Outer membrane protein OmpU [Moritella yayanosii]
MTKINKALSLTLAAVVSMPTLAENINTDDFSFGGRIEARGVLADSDFSDASRVRLNGQGKHEINDAITAVGKFEFEVTQDEDASTENDTRYLYVGAETAYGTVTYGTQDNAVTYLTNFTDMAEYFSGYTNGHITASDDRAEDTLLYSVTKGDLTFNASANLKATENGGGVMVAYKLLPSVELSAGYAATEGFDTNLNPNNIAGLDETESSDVYMIGARYTKDGFLLAGLVQTGSYGGSDFDAVDAYAAYAFGKNNVNVSYNYYSADDISELDINFVAFEYARYIDDVAVYASYKIAINSDTSAGPGHNNNSADEFVIGARYSF